MRADRAAINYRRVDQPIMSETYFQEECLLNFVGIHFLNFYCRLFEERNYSMEDKSRDSERLPVMCGHPAANGEPLTSVKAPLFPIE